MKKRRKHSNFFLILLCMVMILTTTYYGEPASYTAFAQGEQSDSENNEETTVLSGEGNQIPDSSDDSEKASLQSQGIMELTEEKSDLEEGEGTESTEQPETPGNDMITGGEETTESTGEQEAGQTEGTDTATGDQQEGDEDKTSTDEEVDSPEEQENESEEKQEITEEGDNEENADKLAALKETQRKITLQLEGGKFEGTDPEEKGWEKNETTGTTETYTYTVLEDSLDSSLDLPAPVREGYTFGGWKKTDGTVITAGEGTGEYTLELKAVTEDLTLTAVWQQYSIDITKATYTRPFDVTNNTLVLSHYNKEGTVPELESEIVPFLNDNVKTLSLDYTISYDDNGNQKTIERTNVPLSIEWEWNGWSYGQDPESKEDFREVETYLPTYKGDTAKVYLNDHYLKQLIADYESSQYTGDEKVEGMSEENIAFSQWGKWDEGKQQYTGANNDITVTSLKIQLGSNYNKDSGISGKEEYMIDTVSPNNVTVNLFDYWQLSPFYYDRHSDSPNDQFYNSKINKGHGLLFFKNAPGGSGTWNSFTGNSADVRAGIVKNTLTNGFPQLNIKESPFNASGIFANNYSYDTDETLDYLFDPVKVKENDYGRAYSNVSGLFKINEDGNYYYSSHQNFAEYDYSNNRFNVYNTWGVNKGGSSPNGQFFPFNTADQVFKLNNNNQLTQSGITASDNAIDHYLGLSMSVDFQQPIDGMVSVGENAKPMTFEFSGDDDVWIFIDDVLVADLGGIHDEASVEIDFSTGEITRHLAANADKNVHHQTIKDMFEAAGKTGVTFNGNTFAGNTNHTLKLFYLERGNYDSNLTLSFNLMEPVDSQIIKLDQDGNPITDAQFSLYEAALGSDGQPILDETTGTYETTGDPIFSNLETDSEGQIDIPVDYDFSQHTYYVLKEKAPDGYFGPGDVLLKYDKYEKHQDGTSTGTNLLLVDNRWTTGAVGNFSATIYQSGDLHYDGNDTPIDSAKGKNGLILAVPMLKSKGTDGKLRPMYGSNMAGFETVSDADERTAALKAALYQIFGTVHGEEAEDGYSYGFQKWYMEWNEEMDRYQGVLNDLPGDATQYYWASGDIDSDMSVSYYFLDLEVLTGVFDDITGKTAEEKLSDIAEVIYNRAGNSTAEGNVTDAVNAIASQVLSTGANGSFGLLDVSLFNRTFGSRIYVPNTQPDLRVRKLDQDGNPIANVQFSLYRDEACNDDPLASGVTDSEGLLIFSETGNNTIGSAYMNFKGNEYYYLKERSTPEGYDKNDKVIPVYVTDDGRVYADALEANDGITVRKGIGKLVQTMAKYAGDGSIDGTLRDITGRLFTVDKFDDINDAIQNNTGDENGEELNFCYGATNAILEYGTHQINGVYPNPYFEVDDGIAGIIVHQNYDAHQGDALYDTYANKMRLDDVNIRGLFTGSTTVVVRNRQTDSKGTFSIKKTVSGTDVPEKAAFDFTVKIEQNEGAAETINLNDSYTYKVIDKDGTQIETGIIQFTGSKDNGWEIKSVAVDGNSNTSSYIKEQNGKYYIHLQAEQMITVTGIPFGLKITAKETDESSSGYQTSVSVNNGQWSSATAASGIVEEPIGNPSFVFHNHKDRVSNLVLKKIVLNENTDKEFTFHITLSTADGGETLTGNYKWQVQDKDGNAIEEDNHSGTIKDGRLDVALKSGEQVVISDLPIDSKYLITEDTMGYRPSVEINEQKQQVQNGSVSGSIEAGTDTDSQDNVVDYSNVRSGSITITKRDGTGSILSGAGFTLYSVDSNGEKTPVGAEKITALAIRTEIDANESGFDKDAMRYNDGTSSYIVHENEEKNAYFYYRLLTETERNQYYAGTLPNSENVEAIVQFEELDLSLTYAIEETTVPKGYVQNAAMEETMSKIKLPLEEGSNNAYYDILYTVTNHNEMILPTSGLKGIAAIVGIGVVLVGAAFVLWRLRRRTKIQ